MSQDSRDESQAGNGQTKSGLFIQTYLDAYMYACELVSCACACVCARTHACACAHVYVCCVVCAAKCAFILLTSMDTHISTQMWST